MLSIKKSEKGQILVLISLAMVGILVLIGLAIDGGQAFSDRRQAQSAADSAALAAANIYLSETATTNVSTKAIAMAAANGYANDGVRSVVTVTSSDSVSGECAGSGAGKDFKVVIVSTVPTWFAPVVGVKSVTNSIAATTRACNFSYEPLFGGNAIVGLSKFNSSSNGDKGNCGIYNWGTSDWVIEGGGVFSNGCARGKGTGVTLKTAGDCVNSVGFIDGFSCQNPAQPQYDTVTYLNEITPDELPCDGSIAAGTADRGIPVATNPGSFTFSDGVYCVTNFDAFDDKTVVLHNAALYVNDPNGFQLKFTGSGFSGSGRTSEPYAGFFMVIKAGTVGTQEIEWRGNGLGSIYGTILAPTTVIDLRGNANNLADHSQLIAYQVETLGTADVDIIYNASENRQRYVPPTLQLLK